MIPIDIDLDNERTSPLLYQADLLRPYSKRLIHGFTGKPYSFGGPDNEANPRVQVLANREYLAFWLRYFGKEWTMPEQVHGKRVGKTGDESFAQTDAVILTEPDVPVMLLFADCVPVVLYDPTHHVGAVIHAGWRGTRQQIVVETVKTLQETVGSNPAELLAVIGPAIGDCCFQVSWEVAEELSVCFGVTIEALGEAGYLHWDEGFPDNPRVDLKALNWLQLQEAGITNTNIEVCPACTRCEEDDLFSYRRGEDGRNAAFMILKP